MGFFVETHGLFFVHIRANTISSRHCPFSISHEMKCAQLWRLGFHVLQNRSFNIAQVDQGGRHASICLTESQDLVFIDHPIRTYSQV